MRTGQKHLLTCRCILPQLRSDPDAPLHRFVVFSIFENDEILPKVVQCNNCGVLHKVIEACTSEVLAGKESHKAVATIEDVKVGLGPNIVTVLESHDVDLPTWEQVSFLVEEKAWGEIVMLTSEDDGESRHGKYMKLLGENLCKVETFMRDEVVK